MREGAPRIAIVQYSSNRDGSAFSGLLLADGLKDAGFATHVIFGSEGPMIEVYASHGHETGILPHASWLRHPGVLRFGRDLVNEWRVASGFERTLDSIAPDLVYVNTAVSISAVLAARRMDVPVVWHLRELFADVGGEMRAPKLFKPVARRAFTALSTRLVAPSRAIAENMLARGIAQADVVPNAAGGEYFDNASSLAESREMFDLPVQGAIVGLPGMLRPMKGHSFFFRTVAGLYSSTDPVMFAVTGTGTDGYEQRLRDEVSDLGIADRVRFLGVVKDMPSFYRSCDITVVPSRAEPFGRTVIESMASGTPVIASRVGGIPEIVQHGETGLLFEYGDEQELARHVRRWLDHPGEASDLAERARTVAEERFHERVYKRRIVEIVREVIGQ